MKSIQRSLLTVAAVLDLAACTAGGTGAPGLNQTNPHDPNFSALQFAVGTANLYGNGNPALNVVSTLRQPNGTSAVGVNTPAITGPFTFNLGPVAGPSTSADLWATIFLGSPSLPETSAAAPVISGTPQTVHPGAPFCDTTGVVPGFVTCPAGQAPTDTSFGDSGGVDATGLAPYNAVAETGQAFSYQPYAQPIYAGSTTVVAPAAPDSHHQFLPWGGPPGFDPGGNGMGFRDGVFPLFTDNSGANVLLGVAEGITVFEFVTPHTGGYSLSTQIATFGPGGVPNISTLTATATLNSLALLPALSTPVVTPDASGDGGATFTAILPAPVTEALVQIVDWGPGGGPNNGGASVDNCQGPKGTHFAPVYYTVPITASGTYQLGALHGANTNLTGGANNLTASHSICTLSDNQNPPDGNLVANAGDNITVQMIGFDYPAYEMALSLTQQVVPQRPALTGTSGQADITISAPVEEDYPNYNVQIPLRSARHPFSAARGSGLTPPLSRDAARQLGLPAH